jgi:histidinol-phosphatase (PHP family)
MTNPKLIDHHMHTNYSPDADPLATMESYIIQAKLQGVEGVMFTDHVDLESPIEIFIEIVDYVAYKKEVEDLKIKTNFPIYMGVEIGYQPQLHEKYNQFLSAHDFDFVICSMHLADGLDFYYGDFFTGKTQNEAYLRYFEVVLECVKVFDDYDVFGHLDFIIRYGKFDILDYDFDQYKEIIDHILRTIISKNKGIELNTSGLRYGLAHMHPKFEIIKRYQELGGKIITLGSDAHRVSDYLKDFDLAKELLLKAGFDEIAVYEKRVPRFVKL